MRHFNTHCELNLIDWCLHKIVWLHLLPTALQFSYCLKRKVFLSISFFLEFCVMFLPLARARHNGVSCSLFFRLRSALACIKISAIFGWSNSMVKCSGVSPSLVFRFKSTWFSIRIFATPSVPENTTKCASNILVPCLLNQTKEK